MHDGCITTARADDDMTNEVLDKQGGQYVDVFFIAIHDSTMFL